MFFPDSITAFPAFSILYSIPYLVLTGFVYVLGKPYASWYSVSKKADHVVALILSVFTLFFGLRWFVMSDTIEYYNLLKDVRPVYTLEYLNSFSGRLEPGFLILNMMCKSLGLGFHSFVLINSLIDFILLYACVKRYSINKPLTLLFFLAFNGILIEFNLMRNVKAMYLFLYSLQYIRDKKLVKFLVVNLIGLSFHTSAILFIPMYWILGKDYNLKFILTCVLITTGIYFLNKALLQDVILKYIMDIDGADKLQSHALNTDSTTFTFGTIERLMTLVLLLWMKYKEAESSPMFNILFNMFIIFYILFCLFGFNKVFTDRIPNLFLPVYWFIYPYIVTYYKRKIKPFYIFIITMVFLKVYIETHMCSAYYETVLFHSTTIHERDVLTDKAAN